MLLNVNQVLEMINGSQMSVDLSLICMQVVVQDVDLLSKHMRNMSPVVAIVNPSVVSGSVVSDLDVQGVSSDSVSLESDLVAMIGNSIVSNPLVLLMNLDIQVVNLMTVDMNSMEFMVQLIFELKKSVPVMGNQSSEMVNLVGVNLDSSSVNNDLVSESVDLSGVLVHSVGVLHDLLLFSLTIQLSGLGN